MTRYFASFFAVALLLLPLRAPNDVVFAQIDAETANVESLDFPILFSKQHNYQGLHIYDAFFQFRPGGGIYVLENPSASKEERRVRAVIDATTPETLGEGVYSSPSLSYDAKKIVFAFKGTANGNTELYEIGIDGTGLRKIVGFESGCNAYCGSGKGWHDVQPSYLPDGRIVFTSTRYSGLVPCANNGVAVLFVVNPDGSDLHTISVNNVTEFNPTVLDDGRILFGRWEYIDKNALTIQSLWTVLPDGTNETALYSNNMVFPEAILQARQVPGNPELVVGTFAGHNGPPRGAIAMVDVSGDKNDENAIFNFEYHDVPTFDRGQSCDPWALNENVVLYSGMISDPLPTARPTDPGQPERIGAVLPQPQGQYNSLLLIDRSGKRVEVLHDDSIDLHTPIPVVPRVLPRLAPETVDREQKVGRFFVNDVYKGLSGVERGAVKWLRVIEETSRNHDIRS
ncbi:MAG: PD40 domain-containing protein [Thermoguttaceae bacterium]|nr:PD40 domain-containing protein [Thermoguttaceae bacterium]